MQSVRILVVVLLALLLAGCGKKQGKHGEIPVEGTLYVDDKPYGPALLSLTPTDTERPSVEGSVKDDGTFTLRTQKGTEGAPEGTYAVTVNPDALSETMLPNLEKKTVEIKKPSDGGTLKLEIRLKSRKGVIDVDPSTGGKQRPKGPTGI